MTTDELRRRGWSPRPLWALTTVVVCLAHAVACWKPQPEGPRAIVLAIDGLDYELTRSLMAQGRMPNFVRLAQAGAFSPLETTMPPQSPVAWSTFTTGLAPETHGIFDFVHRDPATLAPYLSTTKTEPPRWVVPLGPWAIPLRAGAVTALRTGEPFWARLERQHVGTTIVRMPANYPVSGLAARELSGMGTPDLLGTYGTFTFYTSAPPAAWEASAERPVDGGLLRRIDVVQGAVTTSLAGPPNPLRRDAARLEAPFTLWRDMDTNAARVRVGAEQRVLKAGEWSDWIPVSFAMAPGQTLHGMCRLFLKQVRPHVELYVSPINIDPLDPALAIASPARFAADLTHVGGRYYTQGMPEDTKAYVAGVLTADEFLRQAATTAAENQRQFEFLRDGSRPGLLFHYFGHVDQVSHVMWRSRNPGSPAYDAAHDAPYARVIEDLYADVDALVGRTLDRLAPGELLVVMSDHGFASWRRTFNLNAWLEREGYLILNDPSRREENGFAGVDWSRTRAYALGLNGLYLNVKGRERGGIVEPSAQRALAEELAKALLAEVDPVTGQPAVTVVHRAVENAGPRPHADREPDLIVGYAKGTRSSNGSALGAVALDVMEDNTGLWSGDHCMDPRTVPGVLMTNRALRQPAASLRDLAAAIERELVDR
jgi:predicted AlkP superfamily phosphohydrolase/phosphomutase